jgi:DNA repair exonuclease SbcCD ATPase subunit
MKTTTLFNYDTMKKRFHELAAERQRIEEETVLPARAKADEIVAKIHELEAELKPLNADFREKREQLVPIDREMAIISRALKGETTLETETP